MKKIQFIFFAFFLAFLGCQGEPATQVKASADRTPRVQPDSDKADQNANEMQESKTDKAELIEFYVEEDKKKSETKKKSSRSSAKTAEAKKTAEIAKTDAPPAKKKKSSSKKAAKMKFDNDTFAFGIIKPGDVIEHKFEFTNTGTKDLVITNAEATCGCTQPSFPFIPIPPGEKGYIGVKYDSTGKLGTQKPTVTLTTNAYPKTRKVYLEGVVIGKMAN